MIAAPQPLAHSNLRSRKSGEERYMRSNRKSWVLEKAAWAQSMGGCYQMLEEIEDIDRKRTNQRREWIN